MFEVSPGDRDFVPPPDDTLGAPPEVELATDPVDIGGDPLVVDDSEPTITAHADREEEQEPLSSGESAPESSVEDGADGPAPTDGGDITPPITPGERTGQPEGPQPGQSLQRILDYTYGSPEMVENAIIREVTGTDAGRAAVQAVVDEYQVSVDDAIAIVSAATGGGDSTLRDGVIASELAHAELQYDEATRTAAGVELFPRARDIGVRITNYDDFTAALQDIPTPEEGQAMPESFDIELGALLHAEALMTSAVLVTQNNEACLAICGGEAPPQSAPFYQGVPEGAVIEPEQRLRAGDFPDHAAAIGRDLHRLGVNPRSAEAISQLAAANDEGLTLEWAVAHNMSLIGDWPGEVGWDRLSAPGEWDAAFRFLDHMEATDPDSELLHEIRAQVTADIERFMEQPGRTAIEAQERLRSRPMLEAALRRFRGD